MMVQNTAHLGDIVSPTIGDLTGQHGKIVAIRLRDNRCEVRITSFDNPNDYTDYQFNGSDLTLIECKHEGVITSEEQSNV